MTENEITEARYIKDNILPKLQEIQRDLYFDEHIRMDVNLDSYKMCVSAYFRVVESTKCGYGPNNLICTKEFPFETFLVGKDQRKRNGKTLRGVRHFVKNWQKRLSA